MFEISELLNTCNKLFFFTLVVAKCQVLYDYDPQQSDELKIVEGDVINVIHKQEDDWWQGELNGIVGIFPATYVQDITGY